MSLALYVQSAYSNLMNNAANTKAQGCMVAVDLMQGCHPEFGALEGEALTECRRVLAMQGYRLMVTPALRAVRGRDESGSPSEVL